MATRIWRPVPGYPEIQVSEDLQFRTIERVVAYVRPTGTVSHRTFPSKKLTVLWCHNDGYATVFVSRVRRPVGCHVLVCLAFHGLPPEGKPWALHRDGDPTNFTPENVYWGNRHDNAQDAIKHGVMSRGEGHGIAKLTAAQVLAIRASSESHACLGRLYEVAPSTIASVRKHKTWAHVEG